MGLIDLFKKLHPQRSAWDEQVPPGIVPGNGASIGLPPRPMPLDGPLGGVPSRQDWKGQQGAPVSMADYAMSTAQPDSGLPPRPTADPSAPNAPPADSRPRLVQDPTGNPLPPRPDTGTDPTEDALNSRVAQDRALIYDPQFKHDPMNKIPLWKRILEGAATSASSIQQANELAMAQHRQPPSLGQTLALVGAGAAEGAAMPKQVADIRHQRDLQQAQGGLTGIDADRARAAAPAQREALRLKTLADAREATARSMDLEAQANLRGNPKPTDWEVKPLEGGKLFYVSKTGERKPVYELDENGKETTKQAVEEDYAPGQDGSWINKHTGKPLAGVNTAKPTPINAEKDIPYSRFGIREEKELDDAALAKVPAASKTRTLKPEFVANMPDEYKNPDGTPNEQLIWHKIGIGSANASDFYTDDTAKNVQQLAQVREQMRGEDAPKRKMIDAFRTAVTHNAPPSGAPTVSLAKVTDDLDRVLKMKPGKEQSAAYQAILDAVSQVNIR